MPRILRYVHALVLGVIVFPLLPVLPPTAAADASADRWAVRSPSGELTARVLRDSDGSLELRVSRAGDPVLTSDLGLRTDAADLTEGLSVRNAEHAQVSEHYETAVGKRQTHDDRANELTLHLEKQSRRLDVQVRAFDDGVGYRHRLRGDGSTTVTSEASSFQPPANALGWVSEHRANYENQFVPVPATDLEPVPYAFPALFRSGETWTLLSESDVDGRYAASHLEPAGDTGRMEVTLPQDSVQTRLPLATPWRLAVIGDLDTVVESDLVTDLASGASGPLPRWVHPGKVAWSWWSDGGSPRSFGRQRDYVDHAAEEGWPYILVDEGWDAAWVPDLVDYARRRGVGVLLWSPWTDLKTQEQRDTLLDRWKSWGVAGLKVDFMDSDTQERMRWYDGILRDTAERELMINFHGSTLPRGIERTWPHVLTMEGVRGAEDHNLGYITPQHNVALSYTRNVVGSMDYTPATFTAARRETSAGHELALPIVYESGWQHPADSVESYDSRGIAEAVLRELPTVWDETEFVSGRPGESVTLARRSGERWFAGSIRADGAGRHELPLDFLPDDRVYTAEVVRDHGHDDLELSHRRVGSDDTLHIPTADNGGFAVLLCPATRGRCVDDALPTRLRVEPSVEWPRPGGDVTVTVPVENDTEQPLTGVEVSLTAPDGWRVEPDAPAEVGRVEPGSSARTEWNVRVPDDEEPGARREFRARLAYSYGGRTLKRTAVAPVHVEPSRPPGGSPFLSDLEAFDSFNWVGPLERDQSNGGDQEGDGGPLTIDGRTYDKGLGGHAHSEQVYYLGGACSRFTATVGVDDEVGDAGSVDFQVWGDHSKLYDTGPLDGSSPAADVDVPVDGIEALRLVLADGGDFVSDDHGDWAEARLHCG